VLVSLLIALAVGLTLTVWNRKLPVVIPKSVAVLPFENLSEDPNNAYFAEGMQEEILTRLASVADLKVISRTSTQRYHSKPVNLAGIAKQLGVANILEGSVQKAAGQVRVNVQLINAQTDSHVWADTYDRKLNDTFGVESEIAKRIAESLRAKVTGDEEQALAVKPTNNPEAYDAYLQGLAFETRSRSTEIASWPVLREAVGFYERAVQRDPNFSIAWARLSRANASLYFNYRERGLRGDAAKRALENAQRLNPNSPDALLALGYYQFYVLSDYEAAKTTFERVSGMLPGSCEVPMALALVARRQGNWNQSIAYFEQALALDPRNVALLIGIADTYDAVRQFPAAIRLYDRMLDIMPNDQGAIAGKVWIYQAQGNLQEAARLLSGINWQNSRADVLWDQLRLERNYGEAIRFLQAILTQVDLTREETADFQLDLALMQRLAGDTAGAKVTAEQVLNTVESLYREKPDDAFLTQQLSFAHAYIGEKDLALKLAERAVVLRPRAKDAMSGPTLEEGLAIVQTLVGENSSAISTLAQLLQTRYNGVLYAAPVTPALLRLDPLWDPLRSDPAFQKLCEEKQ
jgi:TolB-like protein/cytochrome c-type biogenesis protein CcmH/NrfG